MKKMIIENKEVKVLEIKTGKETYIAVASIDSNKVSVDNLFFKAGGNK